MKLYAFGEILWDVFPTERHIGGATLNIAAHFSLHGGHSMLVSAVGDDELGRAALDVARELKIDISHTEIKKDRKTGESVVTLDGGGLPSYTITEGVAYDFIKTDEIMPSEGDVLYFGTLSLRESHNRESLTSLIGRTSFAEIFADVNLRAPFIYKESMKIALEYATVLKISEEELPTLSKMMLGKECGHREAAALIKEKYKNVKLVIITLGENGSYVFDTRECREYTAAAKRVKVLSTVGAGDSYSAAFLYGYMKGESIEKCLENATRVSAFVVSKPEAVPIYKPSELT